MTRTLLTLLLCAAGVTAGESVTLGDVVFRGNPEEAFVDAEKEKKLVFVWRLLGSLDGGC